MNWQGWVALGLVAAAALAMVRKLYQSMARNGRGGCCGDCHCGEKRARRPGNLG
jgi:hypothetical protein